MDGGTGCEACADAAEACFAYLRKPLGTYVGMAAAFSLAVLCCCLNSLNQQDVLAECGLPEGVAQQVGVVRWLYCQASMAWLNMFFAPYLQHQLIQGLLESGAEWPEPGMPWQLTREHVLQSLCHVFEHDVGVCFSAWTLMASFAWSYAGVDWVTGSRDVACNPGGTVAWAAWLGMLFFWSATLYVAVWYCYLECGPGAEAAPARYMAPQEAARWRVNAAKPVACSPSARGPTRHSLHSDAGLDSRGAQTAPLVESYTVCETVPPQEQPLGACVPRRAVKLALCVALDLLGDATYALLPPGESLDLAFAPAQAVSLQLLFSSGRTALVGLLEELLPYTDLVPTATLAWCLEAMAPESAVAHTLGLGRRGGGRRWDFGAPTDPTWRL
mmetsp:Transcript_54516/g.174839  ORF Transcript_54516/g.174839 Transcript_54516/m.174839 type:complete len:386 (-) Transcript_54516:127-1284(-)